MNMNKKGGEKYYILISLILGILIIAITFSWIFSEYLFDENSLDLQKCKQSILARNTIPNNKVTDFFKLQENYPLECETRAIEINSENANEAETIIANAITACWALYDRGEAKLFSAGTFFESSTTACFTCARIHFTEEAKRIISTPIDTREMLETPMETGQTYLTYLTENSQNRYLFSPEAFNPIDFTIGDEKLKGTDYTNIQYPNKINPNFGGDLHITLASWVLKKDDTYETENNIFFYQNFQDNIKELSETKILDNWFWKNDLNRACGYWDGINS